MSRTFASIEQIFGPRGRGPILTSQSTHTGRGTLRTKKFVPVLFLSFIFFLLFGKPCSHCVPKNGLRPHGHKDRPLFLLFVYNAGRTLSAGISNLKHESPYGFVVPGGVKHYPLRDCSSRRTRRCISPDDFPLLANRSLNEFHPFTVSLNTHSPGCLWATIEPPIPKPPRKPSIGRSERRREGSRDDTPRGPRGLLRAVEAQCPNKASFPREVP